MTAPMTLKAAILSGAALALLAGCTGMHKMDSAMEVAPALSTSPKKAGAIVTVDTASIAADGWLVIHATKDGKPVAPSSIGHVALKAGTSSAVEVPLSVVTQPGDVVIAMLHHDTGAIGTYEFGPGSVAEDKPVVADGKPVVAPIKIE